MLYANNLLSSVVYNGDLSNLKRRIQTTELVNFSLHELRLLRNIIYAQYDYKFISEDLNTYYSQFEWYSGTENTVETYLITVDYENISLIKYAEENYPRFISYSDEKIGSLLPLLNEASINPYQNFVIMGWSGDGKILYVNNSLFHAYFYIYDLKRNKMVWTDYPDNEYKGFNERLNAAIEAAKKYNIQPVVDNNLTNIDEYRVSSRLDVWKYVGVYSDGTTYEESHVDHLNIMVIHNVDNAVVLWDDIHTPNHSTHFTNRINPWEFGNTTENDILYSFIQSPFETQISALLVTIPAAAGGDNDGTFMYHKIIGIDTNKSPE